MRNNLGRQGSRRQDLGLVRDIDRSRLRFLLCVIRVPAGPLRVDATGLMCLVGRSHSSRSTTVTRSITTHVMANSSITHRLECNQSITLTSSYVTAVCSVFRHAQWLVLDRA